MEKGSNQTSSQSDMLRMVTLAPKRRIKWALGLTVGFGLTVLYLLKQSNTAPTKSIFVNTIHQQDDDVIPDPLTLCQPSASALSNNTLSCLGTRPTRLPRPSTNPPPLPHIPLPKYCLDAHFATGIPCSGKGPGELDVVWIWTNGSDPLFQNAIEDAEETSQGFDTTTSKVGLAKGAKLYREHDELRYSLRSVLQHFGKHTSNLRLLTTDVGNANGTRFGILPQWLDFNTSTPAWRDGNVKLNVVHHSQFFENLPNSTFNSFSIESQLYGLTTASDPFIYMNDDFFFTRDLAPTDFYSSAYGLVLRMDPGLFVEGDEWPQDTPSGEWQPLKYSNWLLSQRFGKRSRPYMIHVAKTLSPAILREVSEIWRDEFLDTAGHRFRGQRDVYTTFLHGHYIVERWRELLLWSWVVGRNGLDNDSLGQEELDSMWYQLSGSEYLPEYLVNLRPRDTLEKARVKDALEQNGEKESAATEYIFSSLDGYPYALTHSQLRGWPKIAQGVDANKDDRAPDWSKMVWARCRLVRSLCLPNGKSASEMFVHLMYTNPEQCGDCVIQALLNQSGRLGLEAFLPPTHRIRYSGTKGRAVNDVDPSSVPRLPLSKTPDAASFKLKAVMHDTGTVHVRDWVLRAMERYRFVIGDTPVKFAMLASPISTSRFFRKIEVDENLALLTINDDVKIKAEMVDKMFRGFLEKRWQFPSAWEDARSMFDADA